MDKPQLGRALPRDSGEAPALHYPGAVTRATFDRLIDHIITQYFAHPSYWTIDGCPYFSVYELFRLIEGLGGIEPTRAALAHFRQRTMAAGFPDLHLNAVVWDIQLLPGEQRLENPNELITTLGFQSVTSYVWIHHVPMREFPITSYAAVQSAMEQYWEQAQTQFSVPYYPNVTSCLHAPIHSTSARGAEGRIKRWRQSTVQCRRLNFPRQIEGVPQREHPQASPLGHVPQHR